MRARLERVDAVAQNIKIFWFKPEHMPRYVPGQFTELFLPHKPKDKRGTKRWFTLSSSPYEDMLAITTKFAAENGSSFKAKLASLMPGDDVFLAYPMGDFVLPKDTTRPLVLVAGGIGVTPFRSMIKSLDISGEQRDVTLIYAANSPTELAFTDLFRHHLLKFIPIVKEADKGWMGQTGTLDAAKILEFAPDKQALFYISGPDPMVKALKAGLKSGGVAGKNIVTDYFPGYAGI